jgi:hypothetical protein
MYLRQVRRSYTGEYRFSGLTSSRPGLASSLSGWLQACLGLASSRLVWLQACLVWLQACLVWLQAWAWLQAVWFGFKLVWFGFKPGFGFKPFWFGFKPVKTIGLQIDIGTGPAGGEAMKKGRMLLPAMPKAHM